MKTLPLKREVMTYCPLCDRALSEVKTPSPRKANAILSDVILAVFLAILLGIADGRDWINAPQGANAAELRATQKQNAILRVAGSDIVGDSLGPALAEAFSQNSGCDESSDYSWIKSRGEDRSGRISR